MDCTVDTTVIGRAFYQDFDGMNAVEILNQIRRSHRIVLDYKLEIYDEYRGRIQSAKADRLPTGMVERWLKHAKDSARVLFCELTAQEVRDLRSRGFDRNDEKFVAACKYSDDKNLIATDSDYSAEIKEFLDTNFQIRVYHVDECISRRIFADSPIPDRAA
jgi:hypothetical protein